ncbi:MAG: bifunctional UDP-N-acetylglucosamine diphosphorylase/glucosamine-1-phosphate N-acetyltransferase GlmU [Pseudomonadales bacterium]
MTQLDKQADSSLEVVVLAAGQGTRMRSSLPKVLHPLAGRPMLAHVLATVGELQPARVHVVVGHGSGRVRETIGNAVNWVEQAEQKGTGHAVAQALPYIEDAATVLVVYGDVPLVSAATLTACVAAAASGALGLVTAHFDDPAELGRILRDSAGRIQAIVEYKDASADQRGIHEINSGILALNAQALRELLAKIEPKNAQAEFYLTDLITLAHEHQIEVKGLLAASQVEVTGVNDRVQLALLERSYQQQQAQKLMRCGVTIADPFRLDIRGVVVAGEDCTIDVNVVFEGSVRLGRGVYIGPGAVIRDSELGDGVRVEAHTLVDGATVDANCSLGPFARIRPGTVLGEGVKIGNFVETKKARLGRGTKASHLTYLGDANIGEDCNIGAGTVTCNYDGIEKHQTDIGDRVFVGTNSTLVAPIEIATDAFVAAGSTVTSKVAEGELAVGRTRQRNIKGWVRPDQRAPEKNRKTDEE